MDQIHSLAMCRTVLNHHLVTHNFLVLALPGIFAEISISVVMRNTR